MLGFENNLGKAWSNFREIFVNIMTQENMQKDILHFRAVQMI